MDRRSLPWKKKSSDKTGSEKPAAVIVESASAPLDSTEPKKEKNFDIFSHLDLMDDFLEMEKLAYQSSDTNGTVLIPDNSKIMQEPKLPPCMSPQAQILC
ncbi:hypothetical protein BC332_34265 [Capsicum chinense]|nr:hypothetical protein BC332_34265 [Capsicum chinense]